MSHQCHSQIFTTLRSKTHSCDPPLQVRNAVLDQSKCSILIVSFLLCSETLNPEVAGGHERTEPKERRLTCSNVHDGMVECGARQRIRLPNKRMRDPWPPKTHLAQPTPTSVPTKSPTTDKALYTLLNLYCPRTHAWGHWSKSTLHEVVFYVIQSTNSKAFLIPFPPPLNPNKYHRHHSPPNLAIPDIPNPHTLVTPPTSPRHVHSTTTLFPRACGRASQRDGG